MSIKIQAAEKNQLSRFIKNFIPKNRQSRWDTILSSSPSKWKKLSMDDLWDSIDLSKEVELIDIERYLESNSLLGNQPGLLIKLSGGGELETGKVDDLISQLVFDDAIILIPDEKFSLASHHGGEWVLCLHKN